MKVTVDRDQCVSCGGCWLLCGEIFEENPPDGKNRITGKYRVNDDLGAGEAPESLRQAAEAAADGCPVAIIHVDPA